MIRFILNITYTFLVMSLLDIFKLQFERLWFCSMSGAESVFMKLGVQKSFTLTYPTISILYFKLLVEAKTQLGFRYVSISTEFFVVVLSTTITVGF